MAGNIKALEDNMRRLQRTCAELGGSPAFDEFFQIIHRGGWTTIIDEYFVLSSIDSLQAQVLAVTSQLTALMVGARQVGSPNPQF